MLKKIVALLLALCLFSCGNNSGEISNNVNQEENSLEVLETLEGPKDFYSNNASYENRIKAAYIANEFAFKTFPKIIKKNENEIYSPYSLYNALAILCNGAGGESKIKLENLLGMSVNDLNNFLKEESRFDSYYNTLLNGLWLDTSKGIEYNQDFINTVINYYGPVINQVNFEENKEALAKNINDWASKATDGKINEVIKPEEIEEDTAFYIANALATSGKWLFEFNKEYTYLDGFNNYDGTVGTSTTMHKLLDGYFGNDICEGISLHTISSFDFIAILPKNNVDIYDFVNSLDNKTIDDLLDSKVFIENYVKDGGIYNNQVCDTADRHFSILYLPKFNYKKEYDFRECLEELGLVDLFDVQKADFSNMANSNADSLYVKKIKQNDTILLDEEKVEASAVTVIEGGVGGGDDFVLYNNHFHLLDFNKPFVYILRGTDGKILFIGVVANMGEDNSLIKIKIVSNGNIRVRTDHSTDSRQLIYFYGYSEDEKLGYVVKPGEIMYAYEKVNDGGYTWYKIGESAWIADQGGQWIQEID